ncbi:MAG: sugar nucleotide-binding protein, partial [Gammaproteobacteria bacterium]|nr:sugar nucleotide-binding protein [Gammaproteobacteria bacterium]
AVDVVDDQIGSPTSTHSLVRLVFRLIECDANGIFHWSDGATISWHGFAEAIQQAGLESGLLSNPIPLNRLSTSEYPTPAARPAYSVLDRSRALSALGSWDRHWQDELRDVIAALALES